MVSEELFRVKWSHFKEYFKENYGDYPSTISALFIIGLENIDAPIDTLSKEQKEEVIHVGMCEILCLDHLYEYLGHDEEGWPHYHALDAVNTTNIEKQENYIRNLITRYYSI